MSPASRFRHPGCTFQVVDVCNKQCRPAEQCKGGVAVLRSEYRGGGGHHHEAQFEPGELELKPWMVDSESPASGDSNVVFDASAVEIVSVTGANVEQVIPFVDRGYGYEDEEE